MDSEDSDGGFFGFLSPLRALLGLRKRPRLSSNLTPLGQGGPSSSSLDSNSNNQASGLSSNLSLVGQEGKASSSSNRSRCDVFISFRGIDTRNTFVDHLYAHLSKKGIVAFKDDKRLQKGELISPQLVQAIQDSRVSIVVFSKDYAASSWCLDEMATIADCHQHFKQAVFPVFYDVNPSHVRKQNGVYRNAFGLHAEKFKQDLDKVDRWKRAMTSLGNSVGWDVRDKPESTMIDEIVQEVIKTLNHEFSCFTEDLIGIQPRVEELEKLLKLSSWNDDFRVLGIWGMGGIGKTTLATVLYDRISYQFDGCCFIENVRKIYADGGAIAVQKQILRQALNEENLDAYSFLEISKIMKNRLCSNIKVLVILDNVDQLRQLQELFKNPKQLCAGSRIIITTRDEHILKVYGVDKIYEVPLLNKNDARELFCRRAFKSEEQSSSYAELIPEVLKHAQCLPLAIKVIGSSLCTREATQWRDALDRLENSPNKEIMDVLEMSVEGLEYKDREIFLHIACFFKGEREDYVKRILDACGLNPRLGIQSIIEKSLITIRNQEIHMHEMLQELGKKIVRHQFPKDQGFWSRVWLYQDFHHLLMTKTEAKEVHAIVLNRKEHVFEYKAQGLSKLVNLELLILYHKKFSGKLEFLSNKLRYLLWHECPFPTLPSMFEPPYLVELNMPYSNIRQIWEGYKDLRHLKRVDLSNSEFLIETPNFEGTPELERLDFTGCKSLLQVDPSIGLLRKLTFLSLRNCSNLVTIDFGSVSNLGSLRVLHLSGCTKLQGTPNFTGTANLEYLDMYGCTSVSLVHESIGALTKLRFLSLRDCTNLVSIPSNINTMTSLITLDLNGCFKLGNIPLERAVNSSPSLESLIFLDVSFCDLHEVPDAIGELSCLERLNLQGNKFVSIPSTITKLSCLAYLNLAHCHELRSLPLLPITSASSVGRYFETTSGSHDHRSGLYVFNCSKLSDTLANDGLLGFMHNVLELAWLNRLVKEPDHFQCGFDVVVPCIDSIGTGIFSHFGHKFKGDSIISIGCSNMDDNWVGFAFCVLFEANNYIHAISTSHHSSSLQLPHPFYLSFESEYTEERFDIPFNLELDKIDGLKHRWTIYISKQHCHFVKTGAHISFKACPGLIVKEWGLCMVIKDDIKVELLWDHLIIYNVKKSRSSEVKIQLPYNWLVIDEDELKNLNAKEKEIALSNLGL